MKKNNPWNKIAKRYDQQFGDEGDYSHRFIIYPALLDLIGDVRDKDVLDLGCGTGTFSRILAKNGAKVVGTDNAIQMISIAKSKKNNYANRIEYLQSDATLPLKLKDQRFDIVFQVMLLHSIEDEDISKVIHESKKVLNDKGEIYIVLPHPFFVKEFKSVGYPSGEQYLSNYETFFVWKQLAEICEAPTQFHLRPLEFYSRIFEENELNIKGIYEPKVVNSKEAMNAKPHIFKRRQEIPGFIILKLVK